MFQQIEIDQYIRSAPLPNMPGPRVGPVVVLRMYGVTADGNSVMAHVHGFTPYFYCQVPAEYSPDEAFCENFRHFLNVCRSAFTLALFADLVGVCCV